MFGQKENEFSINFSMFINSSLNTVEKIWVRDILGIDPKVERMSD